MWEILRKYFNTLLDWKCQRELCSQLIYDTMFQIAQLTEPFLGFRSRHSMSLHGQIFISINPSK